MAKEINKMPDMKMKLGFAAINKRPDIDIPSYELDFNQNLGRTWLKWGSNDDYGNFLFQLYNSSTSVASIINGTTNFITGNEVRSNMPGWEKPNRKGETWEYLLQHLASDYMIYGHCYIQVIRNNKGDICDIYWLDARYLRTTFDNEIFYYSKDFVKSYHRSNKMLVFPKYVEDNREVPTSVIMLKTPYSRLCYGTPIWNSAVRAATCEAEIDNFHLSEITNNFTPSAIINFNNGVPSDEQADEMERNINEKFVGSQNAGRFLLSFNNGKDNQTTVERLVVDDFDKRYLEESKAIKNEIFGCFGANPNLFGWQSEDKGFNSEEYSSTFKIYNRIRVKPIQKMLIDNIDKVLNTTGSLTITPFSLEEGDSAVEDINIQ